MTEQALNQLARRVMLDAARLECGNLLEEPPEYTFSPAFERRMKKLLRRGRHPVWYRTLHAAACVLLALLLSGCAVLVVSPEAREVFSGWVREVHEAYFLYRFFGDEEKEPVSDESAVYQPAYVPAGYRMERKRVLSGIVSILYINDQSGNLAAFGCFLDTTSPVLQVERDSEDIHKKVFVNGLSADLYLDAEEGEANVLVWVDGENGAAFRISGVFGEEELVSMAESVRATPREVFFHPDWLPEGYCEVSAEDYPGEEEGFPDGLESGKRVLTYMNEQQEELTITYAAVFDAIDLRPDRREAEAVSVQVGEAPAFLFLEQADANHLVWADGKDGVLFWISGPLSGEELIQIGESMQTFPEPPLEERRLAWVPAGYRESSRVMMGDQGHVQYQNEEGYLITLGYQHGGGVTSLHLIPSNGGGLERQTVLVDGRPADFYLDRDGANALVWEEDGLLFSLLGYCSAGELAAMAESQEVISPDRRPAWVPEGYAVYERSYRDSAVHTVTIYENPEGETIMFRRQPNGDPGLLHLFPNEGSVEKHVFVGGNPADLVSATKPGSRSEMCWSDGEALYFLSGNLSDEEMLNIAESVGNMPPLPATHIPTWLPLGYRNTSVFRGLWSVEAEYKNEAGERIFFRFARRSAAESSLEERREEIREAVEGLEGQDVLVNGCPGRLYPDAGGVRHLVWGPEGAEEVYWLSGPVSGEVLMEIAGGVNRTAE